MVSINYLSSCVTLLLAFMLSCKPSPQNSSQAQAVVQTKQDTCNDPDANINCCFVNMPSNLTNIMTIAGPNEPGDRLLITGTVTKKDGTPYSNVIMYAYHTDNTGHYSKKGNETGFQKWHGHLHGWCKTDNAGRYEIQSIRPARYPDNSMPAHIHSAFKLPDGSEPFYITDFVFKDDSLVTPKYISSATNPGGTGVVEVTRSANGTWRGQRNIVLEK